MKLSIIVPMYNEEKTIPHILEKLSHVDLGVSKEIIIVDDGSRDNSKKVVQSYLKNKKKSRGVTYRLIGKENGGKGSAIKKGFEFCKGNIITIQDADLEYNPEDYRKLILPIIKGKESVVYGSRFLKKHTPRYRIYFWGNKFLTLLTKILYRSRITDMETCYKVFKAEVIKNIQIEANHFDFEPEVTARILKKGIRIKEIPISYTPRSIEEGKKINWKDGLQAIWTLIYWRVRKDI